MLKITKEQGFIFFLVSNTFLFYAAFFRMLLNEVRYYESATTFGQSWYIILFCIAFGASLTALAKIVAAVYFEEILPMLNDIRAAL